MDWFVAASVARENVYGVSAFKQSDDLTNDKRFGCQRKYIEQERNSQLWIVQFVCLFRSHFSDPLCRVTIGATVAVLGK
jgi:hypothetical protein